MLVRKKSSERISEIEGDLGPETVVVLEEGRSEVKVGLDTCDIGDKYEGRFGTTGSMVKCSGWFDAVWVVVVVVVVVGDIQREGGRE